MVRSYWSVWDPFWTRKGLGAVPHERGPPQGARGSGCSSSRVGAEAKELPLIARDRDERAVYLARRRMSGRRP